MRPLTWFRVYAEAVDDAKLRQLSFDDRWHFVAMLCLKAQGILDIRDDQQRKAAMTVKLGLDSVELETVMKRLVTVGLIDKAWKITNWSKRQFISDSSTSRVRAFRKRFGNVTETPSESETEQIQSRAEKKAVAGLDLESWSRWKEYRRAIGKRIKEFSEASAQKKLAEFGSNQAAVVEQSIAQGWTGLFPLKREAKAQSEFVAPKTIAELEAEEAARGRK